MIAARRKPSAELSREVILDAAAVRLAREGSCGMSMRDLAGTLGCALSSVYNHFPSKDVLLQELQERAFETLTASARRAMEGASGTSGRLYLFITNHVRYVVDHRDVMSVLVHEAGRLGPEGRARVRARKEAYFGIAHALVAELCSAGPDRASQVAVERLTYHLFGMLNWLWGWYVPDRHGEVALVAGDIYALLLARAGPLPPAHPTPEAP